MATIVTTSSGYTYRTYPAAEPIVIAHTLQTVDGGVHIDSTNNNLDQTHLLLSGALPATDYYIRCHDFSEDVFTVDGDGEVKCAEIEASALTLPIVGDVATSIGDSGTLIQTIIAKNSSQDTEITALEDVVEAATRLKGGDTLVKRGPAATFAEEDESHVELTSVGTEIQYLKASQVHALAPQCNISVFGDGTFNWVAAKNGRGTREGSIEKASG